MTTATKRQAKYHGEIGANGKAYQKGQFIAEQKEYQGRSVKTQATHKVEIAPYQWMVLAEGEGSIYSQINLFAKCSESSFKAGDWKFDLSTVNVKALEFYGHTTEWLEGWATKFNAGERTYSK